MEVLTRCVTVGLLLTAAGVMGYTLLSKGLTSQTEPTKTAKSNHQTVTVHKSTLRAAAQPIAVYDATESGIKLASAEEVLTAGQTRLALPTIEAKIRPLPAVESRNQISELSMADVQSQLRPTSSQAGRHAGTLISSGAANVSSLVRAASLQAPDPEEPVAAENSGSAEDAEPAQVLPAPVAPHSPLSGVTVVYTEDPSNAQRNITVSANEVILVRTRQAFTISGTMPATFDPPADYFAALLIDGRQKVIAPQTGNTTFSFAPPNMPILGDGPHTFSIFAQDKSGTHVPAVENFNFTIKIRTKPVSVSNIDANSLSFSSKPYRIRVTFDTGELTTVTRDNFSLIPISEAGQEVSSSAIQPSITSHIDVAAIELSLDTDLNPGVYRLRITGITGLYGNGLAVNNTTADSYDADLLKPVGGELPSVRPGITGSTGPYVPFKEFTGPRDVPDGFNPNDKVETRVVRLYYYRDAHRVAQIVNRKVRSYNRQGVDMARQLADKARNEADQQTVARQQAERAAIIKAQKTREKERELQAAQQSLNRSIQELGNYQQSATTAPDASDTTRTQLENLVNNFSAKVDDLQAQVEKLRDEEVAANELSQQAEAQEKLARDNQFRREVAAAHSDPDTYVAGVPESSDPVEQVSVSVVGEGLIQLRGPLKGINQIRIMIDQLDSPVGQVRISVHSVQINGEHADNMEVVAKRIQQYIDQARFLTAQSAEMLRKAVVQVASRKAEEARALNPGDTQEDRDHRYLYAFFGQDFVNELRTIDSEFLHTENKLLSLHSMDTTSLSSALNLMALAKNSTRDEIFMEFDSMLQGELPQAEMNYLAAGHVCEKKKFPHRHCKEEIFTLGQNAKFESLRGFFNTQVGDAEIMTSLQREFIRLAQIFKNRLITEMEYKQRVMERAVIEERLGNRVKELREARVKEETANTALRALENSSVEQRVQVITLVKEIDQEITSSVVQKLAQLNLQSNSFAQAAESLGAKKPAELVLNGQNVSVSLGGRNDSTIIFTSVNDFALVKCAMEKTVREGNEILSLLKSLDRIQNTDQGGMILQEPAFETNVEEISGYLSQISTTVLPKVTVTGTSYSAFRLFVGVNDSVRKLADRKNGAAKEVVDALSIKLSTRLNKLLSSLTRSEPDAADSAFEQWLSLKDNYLYPILKLNDDDSNGNTILEKLNTADNGFRGLLEGGVRLDFAQKNANESRRPLDHKKFLDMLIDELEEKYIELLDGTRAQTANVDNYLKRITTALDDDFNRQFYFPTFRFVRETSQMRDVQFGQTETTTILANNREFAKVDPSATMEFDLPKRDILLTEGINSAKALMDDVGALANDPTFLAMASMQSGQGNSPGAGSTGGNTVVRSVLPGLSSETSEEVMSQNSNGENQFGSNLENLIPDPAIYKFETGTGYEIRPVIQPDGQAVVFDFNYMYTTNIREPVRADEKHLGRVKRHYVDTDVQLSNFELREVSRYTIALKASRTSRGVPLLEDIPVAGVLFRPLPSDEKSLQQNLIMAQATIFPTLFDLMGLRWAPVVADMDPLRMSNQEFIVRNRHRMLENRVYDEASSYVDEFMRIPVAERRMDLYRSQETIPALHPNGYQGPGMNLRDSQMQEGYQPNRAYPQDQFYPGASREGARFRPGREDGSPPGTYIEDYPLQMKEPANPLPAPINEPGYDEGSRRRTQAK